jgi:hypothetical protein
VTDPPASAAGGAIARSGRTRANTAPLRAAAPHGTKANVIATGRAPAGAAPAPVPWYLPLGALGPLSSPLGGRTLTAAVHLVLPIAVGAVVLLFLFAQAQIDKRDPKLTGAPIRREDDGMSFE